ncbi:short chain dehydrogenase [Williamsia sp. 1138]|uniref:SDR family oxidoreductase n=1 Tax=Gordonia rubripertincta TaxID=36822 RepID=A0ABT4MW53_GORRU|nr:MULTISPECIES: SDR family oxidoreductase [Mycobacteriales]MCZ4551234.1 SDR family oxidoreductase [Gordonia rubripertincta]OZG29342.1 short chain dehydrogenase [Williamsia sp. 1138]
MAYFVTGATGFIGRNLLGELLDNRDGEIFVLVRRGSRRKIERLIRQWDTDRVTPVVGDLQADNLGVDPAWIADHRGDIDHFFHLAAIYDMTASDEANEMLNVGGTRAAISLAEALDVGCFHQVSSVAAAGEFRGRFDESMFDEGQELLSAYHRTKFESERIVRDEATVPWRVYRPAIVLGHSETGAMDKIDGPYYFFPLFRRMRDALPGALPLLGVDLGDTNVVPVDYVARAMDHLAHLPGRDGEAFHLVNPKPQNTVGMVNTFAAAAGAPKFAVPVDRSVTDLVPTYLLPRALQPSSLLGTVVRSGPAQFALRQTIGRLGIPPEVLAHVSFPGTFSSYATEEALAGSGISVPELDTYAANLWTYWEQFLDDSIKSDRNVVKALSGKTVVITGASSGIGLVTAVKVAKAGGIPILVARGLDKLEATKDLIEGQGGTAYAYGCDLSDLDAIDALTKQLGDDFDHIDFIVNNAGRSIRRSLKLSEDRFHDFERTMQLNYFGAIRLVIGLLPTMRAQGGGHIVNVSSIGVQTNPPRFSAYVASKAALDSWSNVVSSELVGDGISFTGIHMPLVRTPMIAPTKLYDRFPTISPGQAADKVITALVDRPHEINTALGNLGSVAHTVTPKLAFRILHLAYQVFPDSAAARGDQGRSESEQILLARVLKGVHW